MSRILIGLLVALTVIDWQVSYLFFKGHGWERAEWHPVIRWALANYGLERVFFYILPLWYLAVFLLLYLITLLLERVKKREQIAWNFVLLGLCFIKIAVVFLWVLVYI